MTTPPEQQAQDPIDEPLELGPMDRLRKPEQPNADAVAYIRRIDPGISEKDLQQLAEKIMEVTRDWFAYKNVAPQGNEKAPQKLASDERGESDRASSPAGAAPDPQEATPRTDASAKTAENALRKFGLFSVGFCMELDMQALEREAAALRRIVHDYEISVPFATIHHLEERLAAEVEARRVAEELHTMQMAAISTAALSNSRNSETPLAKGHPYWTPAYQDTVEAVGREMDQRERAAQAEAQLLDSEPPGSRYLVEIDRLTQENWRLTQRIEQAEAKAREAG